MDKYSATIVACAVMGALVSALVLTALKDARCQDAGGVYMHGVCVVGLKTIDP